MANIGQGGSSVWTENTTGDIGYESGNVGIGTDVPSQKLEVNGNIKASGGIKIGAFSNDCNNANIGTIRFNSTNTSFEGCNGVRWIILGRWKERLVKV